jgi:hypothetical protein
MSTCGGHETLNKLPDMVSTCKATSRFGLPCNSKSKLKFDVPLAGSLCVYSIMLGGREQHLNDFSARPRAKAVDRTVSSTGRPRTLCLKTPRIKYSARSARAKERRRVRTFFAGVRVLSNALHQHLQAQYHELLTKLSSHYVELVYTVTMRLARLYLM